MKTQSQHYLVYSCQNDAEVSKYHVGYFPLSGYTYTTEQPFIINEEKEIRKMLTDRCVQLKYDKLVFVEIISQEEYLKRTENRGYTPKTISRKP